MSSSAVPTTLGGPEGARASRSHDSKGKLRLDDDLVQRRSCPEVGVGDRARELRLDLDAVVMQEQIHSARYLQIAVLLGIAVEPVEVALRLDQSPPVPGFAVQAV